MTGTLPQRAPTTSSVVNARKFDPRLILALIMLAALGLRIAAAVVLPDQIANLPDATGYREAGRQLWSTGFMQTPYFMPLYPALVAVLGPGWKQLAVDILLSTSLVWLVYELSLALFADTAAALLAAAGTALYPSFIFFAVVGLSEPLFMALFVAAMVCWYRGWFAAAAAAAVLSIMTRPAIDLLAPVLVVYFALVIHRLSVAAAAGKLLIYAAIYCAFMTPWWISTYHLRGAFVRLDLGGGANFYSGNNPMNQTGGGVDGVDYDSTPFEKIADPVARDRAYWDAGLRYIRENPQRFFHLAAIKFVRFWRLWPYAESYASLRYVVASLVSYVPVLILSLVYLAVWGRAEFFRIAPLLAFAAYLTLVNVVFVASLRYRLPIEPLMIVLAAVAVARLGRKMSFSRAWLAHAPIG